MGHIGFSLALKLADKNKVVGLYNKTINKERNKHLKKNNIELIQNDLSDINKLEKIFVKHNITKCVYCAAVSHEIYAKEDPYKTINTNSLYVLNFLELLRSYKNIGFIYISTGSVFQDVKDKNISIDESTVPTPKSIYAGSKRMGEIIIENYVKYYNINSCILRVSWVYGPPILNDTINIQRGPIPYLLNQLIINNKDSITFNSGGEFEASFTYIDDVVNAICTLINVKVFKSIYYNLGTGENNSNYDLANIINEIIPSKKVSFGKNNYPWSTDSVSRGPIVGVNLKKDHNFKIKYNLKNGMSKFIKIIIDNA